MTEWDDVRAELQAEHADCLADDELRRKARLALPAAEAAFERARMMVTCAEDNGPPFSGLYDLRRAESSAEQRLYRLEALARGDKGHGGIVGYHSRARVEEDIEIVTRSG